MGKPILSASARANYDLEADVLDEADELSASVQTSVAQGDLKSAYATSAVNPNIIVDNGLAAQAVGVELSKARARRTERASLESELEDILPLFPDLPRGSSEFNDQIKRLSIVQLRGLVKGLSEEALRRGVPPSLRAVGGVPDPTRTVALPPIPPPPASITLSPAATATVTQIATINTATSTAINEAQNLAAAPAGDSAAIAAAEKARDDARAASAAATTIATDPKTDPSVAADARRAALDARIAAIALDSSVATSRGLLAVTTAAQANAEAELSAQEVRTALAAVEKDPFSKQLKQELKDAIAQAAKDTRAALDAAAAAKEANKDMERATAAAKAAAVGEFSPSAGVSAEIVEAVGKAKQAGEDVLSATTEAEEAARVVTQLEAEAGVVAPIFDWPAEFIESGISSLNPTNPSASPYTFVNVSVDPDVHKKGAVIAASGKSLLVPSDSITPEYTSATTKTKVAAKLTDGTPMDLEASNLFKVGAGIYRLFDEGGRPYVGLLDPNLNPGSYTADNLTLADLKHVVPLTPGLEALLGSSATAQKGLVNPYDVETFDLYILPQLDLSPYGRGGFTIDVPATAATAATTATVTPKKYKGLSDYVLNAPDNKLSPARAIIQHDPAKHMSEALVEVSNPVWTNPKYLGSTSIGSASSSQTGSGVKKTTRKKTTRKKPARYYFANVQDARKRLMVLERERRIAKNDSPELYNEMMAIKMMLEKASR